MTPRARPASVTAFAARIRQWLDQRPALRLLDDARRVDALEAAAERPTVERAAREADFDGIRSALAQVASLLPAGAVEPLQGRAAVAIARVALADGDPDAAELRLGLPGIAVAPDVLSELRLLITRQRAEAARREAEAERLDPGIGRRLRGWAAVVMGVIWVALPLQSVIDGVVPPLEQVALGNAVLGVVVLIIFATRWQSLGRTVPNRLLLLVWMIVTFGFALFDAWGHLQGLDAAVVYVQHLLMVTVVCGVFCVGVEPRGWPVVVTSMGAMFAAARWPEHVMALTAFANCCIWFALVYLSLWRPWRARMA